MKQVALAGLLYPAQQNMVHHSRRRVFLCFSFDGKENTDIVCVCDGDGCIPHSHQNKMPADLDIMWML